MHRSTIAAAPVVRWASLGVEASAVPRPSCRARVRLARQRLADHRRRQRAPSYLAGAGLPRTLSAGIVSAKGRARHALRARIVPNADTNAHEPKQLALFVLFGQLDLPAITKSTLDKQLRIPLCVGCRG